ncbi:MAG: 2OG-Fe(II) oxygenase family protein [Pseudomonadota bacterium]
MGPEIPRIAAADVLAGKADVALAEAATGPGFLRLAGVTAALDLPVDMPARLLRFFDLPPAAIAALARSKFVPAHPNVYRGVFPLQPGETTYKEGIDIGPDLLRPEAVRPGDPLTEATPLPEEGALPGWREEAAAWYGAMEHLGAALVTGLARGLGRDPAPLAAMFEGGISTLRLIHYPERPEETLPADRAAVAVAGDARVVVGAAHVDSGFVTLLWQDDTGGLQAKGADGWIEVPPEPGGLAVNFGALLADLTGGAVRATEHRVLGGRAARASIPFFFEPAVDAPIPLPTGAAPAYGDLLWSRMTRFVEFRGVDRQT